MLAGLEPLDGGAIHIGDRDVSNVRPRDRDIAMVFQSYALYPQLTVAENMGFALKQAKVPKEERIKRVREAARVLDLEPYLDRKPKDLSGGQRQRVAMGRAIVRKPPVYLMDEPLSNLDAKLRVQTRTEVVELQNRLGVTTVYVTHDQVEAMTMGHRVAVLKDGVLQQCDTPRKLYHEPVNLFVAGFIGSPAMNLVDVGEGRPLKLGDAELVPAAAAAKRDRRTPTGAITVGFRPEALRWATGRCARRSGPLRISARRSSSTSRSTTSAIASRSCPRCTPPFDGEPGENVALQITGNDARLRRRGSPHRVRAGEAPLTGAPPVFSVLP